MSRSYKKEPIIKDRGDQCYNRKFRRKIKQIDLLDEDIVLPLSQELTDDYDVSDWLIDARDFKDKEMIKKFKRK